MNNLNHLENESISIIRDTFKESLNPVVLYSVGKDSSVLLHLFRKAFFPIRPKVKFLHIDTGWKFKEMIIFRDQIAKKHKINLEVFQNQEGVRQNVTPFTHENYTDIMKTNALKQALFQNNFDFIYGGARRDEESSRSKEKVLSHRNVYNKWDPKNQRLEPWNLFNFGKKDKESFRVFPLSNWTELNIWEYIKKEKIEVVPLYFAKERKIILRDNEIYLYDDNRFPIKKNDKIKLLKVRFRTLGCYPLTTGHISSADSINKIIKELELSNFSERSGRLIDFDKLGSMEIKKIDGYF